MNESNRLLEHRGHAVGIVTYGEENVALECEECHEVILDYAYLERKQND